MRRRLTCFALVMLVLGAGCHRQRADAAIAAGGADDDPRWIHTDAYDDAVEIGLSVYNRLFNDELGPGGWDNINAARL